MDGVRASGCRACGSIQNMQTQFSSEARFGRYVSVVISTVPEMYRVCLQTGEGMSQEIEILFGKQGEEKLFKFFFIETNKMVHTEAASMMKPHCVSTRTKCRQ